MANNQNTNFIISILKPVFDKLFGKLLNKLKPKPAPVPTPEPTPEPQPTPTPVPTPVPTPTGAYYKPVAGELPSDEDLKKAGYVSGDVKWTNEKAGYMITPAKDGVNFGLPGWTQAGVIG